MNLFLKILISAALIGIISEVSRRYSTVAALLAALPLISLLSMMWMYHDTHDIEKISAFSMSVFWYVLPSLVLFVLLPVLLRWAQLPFYTALAIASAATVVCFFIMKFILARFGISL